MTSLDALLLHVLGECLAASQTLADVLAGYADAAADADVAEALARAGAVVDRQAEVLERYFDVLGVPPRPVRSAAVDGALDDTDALVASIDDPATADTALVGCCEAALLFVRARFLAAACHADRLGRDDVTHLLNDGARALHDAASRLSHLALRCVRAADLGR